jgi:SecD/SecF fusion protein
MQGKGIIRVFLVLMSIVCLGQFILIFPTRKVEKAAQEHAVMMAAGIEDERERQAVEKAARVSYLDSMSSEVVFSLPLLKDYTYTELKQQQLALGLDLKGGMSVVLQVDLRDFIVALSNNSKDPTFLEALDKASERIKTAQSDYVTVFADAFRENTEDKTLASIFSRNQTLRDEINFETPDNEVVQLLRTKANETVDLTYKRIKDRIDKFGVTQPNVSLDASRDLIIVELPGVDNPERARSYLQASAKLEFWDVYRVSDPGVIDAFIQADERLKKVMTGDTTDQVDENFRLEERYSYTRDSISGDIIDSTLVAVDTIPLSSDPMTDRGPLLSLLTINSGGAGQALNYPLSVMGVADRNKKNNVNELLSRPDVKALFPKDMEFRWSYKPMQDYATREYTDQYELYAIKTKRGSNVAPLEGDRVTNAGVNPDPRTGEVAVSLTMDNRGTKIWADMTTKAAQDNNREVAIVLDDEVVSAPRVNDAILTGSSQISGNFSIQEAKDLANILQVGKLPASTKIIQESLVGPSLGKENIRKSISALIGGFALVFIFMIFYYAGGGIVSILALLLNLFFIFGALASYGTVLTLPGIAGIVLTIGMAVDANVIIFERIKEELRAGKSTMLAIKDGFNQSYSAIIDANVTTLLVAFILAYFGMGPIKGFAVVLIIGVLMSLFTAVLVGRLTIDWWIRKGNNIGFWSGLSKNLFSNINIDWIGKRKIAYVVSGTVLALGLTSFIMRGFELGVDFKGGYSYNIQFDQEATINADALRTGLTEVFDGATPVVKAVDTRNTFNVVTSYRINDDSDEAAGKLWKHYLVG